MKQNKEEFSLKDLWDFIISKIWVIILAMVVGAVGLFVYTKTHNTVTYSVSTSLFVYSVSSVDGVQSSNVTVSKQRVPLYMEIIKSNRDFHEEILKTMSEEEREVFGFSLDPEELSKSLDKLSAMIQTEVMLTEQSGELEMFSVHVSSSNEDCALRVTEIIRDIATNKEKDAQGNPTNAIYKNIPLPSEINCVDSPRFRSATARYNPVMSAAIGGFAGALLVVFALFFFSALDSRVRNRKTLEKNFEIPILGVIPNVAYESVSKKDHHTERTEEQ